jgi:hypothetical protein
VELRDVSEDADHPSNGELQREETWGVKSDVRYLEIGWGLEAVKSPSLALKGVDDIEGGDGLPPGVLCICDGVSDDVLEEVAKDATDFFVDVAADALDATSASEPADRWLRDALDILTHHLSMALGAALAKALAALPAAGHSR